MKRIFENLWTRTSVHNVFPGDVVWLGYAGQGQVIVSMKQIHGGYEIGYMLDDKIFKDSWSCYMYVWALR